MAVTSAISSDEAAGGESVYGLEVWCEDGTGKKLTAGDAVVHSSRR